MPLSSAMLHKLLFVRDKGIAKGILIRKMRGEMMARSEEAGGRDRGPPLTRTRFRLWRPPLPLRYQLCIYPIVY